MSDWNDEYEELKKQERGELRPWFTGAGLPEDDLRDMVKVSKPHHARYPLPGQLRLLLKKLPGRGLFVYRCLYDIILARGLYSFAPDKNIDSIGDEEVKNRLRREKGAKAISEAISFCEVNARYYSDAEQFRDAIEEAVTVLRRNPGAWMLKDPPPKDQVGRDRYLKDFMGTRPSGIKWAERELGGTDHATLLAHWHRFHATLAAEVTAACKYCEEAFAKVASLDFRDVIRAYQEVKLPEWKQMVADKTGLDIADVPDGVHDTKDKPLPKGFEDVWKSHPKLKSDVVTGEASHYMKVKITLWYIEHRLKDQS